MKLALQNGDILIADCLSQLQMVKSLPGIRFNKSQKYWYGPATKELLDRLSSFCRLPKNLEMEHQRLNRIQAAIDAERLNDNPKYLYPYPIRSKINMYKHQIRGANMALITLGLVEPKGAV